MALLVIGLGAAPASANGGGSTKCNGTVTGGTIASNLNVGNNAVCVLNGVTVDGNVSVAKNAYFEANGSTINGNVSAYQALTLYIWGNSTVTGNVAGASTAQVFVYDSTVKKSVAEINSVKPGYGHFQVCGSTVSHEIGAATSGPDILVGDPAAGCGGNTVLNGDIAVVGNTTDSELFVIGNNVNNGDINVYLNNVGAGVGVVSGNNAPNGDLFCANNTITTGSFDGSGNGTVGDVPVADCQASTITGVDTDDGA
jgi:hypothetical protein